MNYDYRKYQTLLRIERLVDKLVEQQEGNRLCHRGVSLKVTPVPASPIIPDPEPTYNRFTAAAYLEKSESSVTRWRKAGQLAFIMEDKEIRYQESVLDAFFLKKWGFPKKKKKG